MLQDAGSKSSLQLLGLAFRTCLEYQVYTVIGLYISFQSRRRINQRKPRLVNELIEVPRQKAATEVSIGLEGSLAHFPCGRRQGYGCFMALGNPTLLFWEFNIHRLCISFEVFLHSGFVSKAWMRRKWINWICTTGCTWCDISVYIEMTLQNDVFFFKWEEEGGHEVAKNLLAFPVNSMASWIIGWSFPWRSLILGFLLWKFASLHWRIWPPVPSVNLSPLAFELFVHDKRE